MSLQQLFDDVVNHARTQRARSTTTTYTTAGPCLYRGPNGTSCFMGALIPDDLYDVDFEKRAISYPLNKSEALRTFLIETYEMNIEDFEKYSLELQNIHDNWYVRDWNMKFITFANEYNLNYTPQEILALENTL